MLSLHRCSTAWTMPYMREAEREGRKKSGWKGWLRKLQGGVQLGEREQQPKDPELVRAHEIQNQLLPLEIPQIPGFQIAGGWQPAKEVCGDYFDVFPLGDGLLGLCVADVSGKGLQAALLMAKLQAAVKKFAPEIASLAALFAKLNATLS